MPPPKQRRLFDRSGKVSLEVARGAYEAVNSECADTILADPECYGGRDSLMCRWAEAVVSKRDNSGGEASDARHEY